MTFEEFNDVDEALAASPIRYDPGEEEWRCGKKPAAWVDVLTMLPHLCLYDLVAYEERRQFEWRRTQRSALYPHMIRFRLRTLLILLAILPPVLAVSWRTYSAWRAERERQRVLAAEPHDPYRFVQNQTGLIKSPMVLPPVGSDAELARTPKLLRDPNPSKRIVDKVAAEYRNPQKRRTPRSAAEAKTPGQ